MLQKMSFRWRLYIIYGSIIAGILIVVMSAFLVFILGLLSDNMEDAALTELEITVDRFEDFMEYKDQQLQFFHTLPEFGEYVRQIKEQGDPESYYINNPEEAEEIQRIFLATLTTEENGSSVGYISSNYNNVYASVTGHYDRTLSNQAMRAYVDVEQWVEGGKACYYIYPHQDYWDLDEETVISVFRPVHDMFRSYGMLVYNVGTEQLNSVLSAEYNEILILEPGSTFYYSTKSGICEGAQELTNATEESAQEGYLKTQGNYSYYYSRSDLTGWTLVMKRDISSYQQDRWQLVGIVLLILVTGIAAILGMLYVVSRKTAAPLIRLKEKLERYVDSQYIHIDVESDNNEVTVLSSSIENMVNEMVRQDQKLIASKEIAYKAQLSAMEAQLNPHFLYNTLSVIGTYGLEQDNMVIPQMCSELSGILRYSVSYSGKTVKLRDEIQNIRSYLYIMEMRYENMMECIWDMDPAVEEAQVPKLILQPIVENCFKHGFQQQKPVWIIKIRTWMEDSEWRAAVSNSGTDLDREKIDAYLKAVNQFDTEGETGILSDGADRKNGFGLRNTILRLHMFYHGGEHFKVFVKEGFTTVELGGPNV